MSNWSRRFFLPDVLAWKDQPRAIGSVGDSLEFALAPQPGVMKRNRNARTVRAFLELINVAVARQHVDGVAGDRDTLEVAAHAPLANRELLQQHATPRIHHVHFALLVVMGEQPPIGRQGEAGHLPQFNRQPPLRKRRIGRVTGRCRHARREAARAQRAPPTLPAPHPPRSCSRRLRSRQ